MPTRGYKCPPGCECGRHRRSKGHRESGRKRCTKCDAVKDLSEFSVHHEGAHGTIYHSACKRCRLSAAYLNVRRRVFEKRYGITLDDYEEMLQDQGGVCAICGKPERIIQSGKIRLLCVDHDHVTGKVRGLLCTHCNQGLGHFFENADTLKNAIYYLQRMN